MTRPRYPVSRTSRAAIRKADLQRDLEGVFYALEAGVCNVFQDVTALQRVNTEGYSILAAHVAVLGLGTFQWDPDSVDAPDNLNIIQPTVGPSATGAGRWVPAGTGGGGGGPISFGSPVSIGVANAPGVSTNATRADHVHAHGDQPGGTLHALATDTTPGFMSAQDKIRLDQVQVGDSKFIRLPITTNTVTSTTVIPPGSIILSSLVNIQEAYNLGTTINTVLAGADPILLQDVSDADVQDVSFFATETLVDVGPTNGGPIQVVVTGATTGSGYAVVEYADDFRT